MNLPQPQVDGGAAPCPPSPSAARLASAAGWGHWGWAASKTARRPCPGATRGACWDTTRCTGPAALWKTSTEGRPPPVPPLRPLDSCCLPAPHWAAPPYALSKLGLFSHLDTGPHPKAHMGGAQECDRSTKHKSASLSLLFHVCPLKFNRTHPAAQARPAAPSRPRPLPQPHWPHSPRPMQGPFLTTPDPPWPHCLGASPTHLSPAAALWSLCCGCPSLHEHRRPGRLHPAAGRPVQGQRAAVRVAWVSPHPTLPCCVTWGPSWNLLVPQFPHL